MAEIAKAYVQVIPSAKGIQNNLKNEFGDSGTKSGNSFSSAFKKVLGKVTIGGAVTALAKGVTDVIKSAISSYSEYEQLVGGTELMLGTAGQSLSEYAASMGQSCSEAAGAYRAMEATQNRVFTCANEAYKTAGLSANDYLTQVNGLAVGLKTALGGDASAAADLADRVVTAEADVVAAMGVSTESVQNAFNGLMKGNYMMLDNLYLGITPTKEGFQQLIDSVNEYNAAQGNATNYTIDNLADCQSALVDYIEMQGISGYAAAEASSTIQGSLNSVKASWENVLTALGGGGNLDSAISGLISSASTLASNLMPVIGTVVSGLVSAIPQLAAGVGDLIPQISETIVTTAPQLMTAIASIVTSLGGAFTQMIPTIAAVIPQLVTALVAAAPQLLIAGYALVQAIVEALPTIITSLVAMIPQMVETLVSQAPQMLAAGITLFGAIVEAVIEVIPQILAAIPQLVLSMAESIQAHAGEMLSAGQDLVQGLINGIKAKLQEALAAITEIGQQLVDRAKKFLQIGSPSRVFYEIGGFVSEGMANGIASGANLVSDAADKMVSGTMSGLGAISSLDGAMNSLGAISSLDGAMNSGVRGMSQINIYAQQLSQADIDYIVTMANKRLGAALA